MEGIAYLQVKNKRIEDILFSEPGGSHEVLVLSGFIVGPGFVDVHVHGYGGTLAHAQLSPGWLSGCRTWDGGSQSILRVYRSGFDYVRSTTEEERLVEQWGSSDHWEWLASKLEEGEG